jgi:hypothetical protein
VKKKSFDLYKANIPEKFSLAESGEYFEQPKHPDTFDTLSNNNFQKLFQEPKICNYDVDMLVREGFFMKKQTDCEHHKKVGQD